MNANKIVCVGRNYVEHIKELNNEMPSEPVYFMKPFSSVSEDIVLPGYSPMHYEGEICFLIGDRLKVGFGFDFTLREIQSELKKKGLPWERAKAFKGAAVFSDFVEFENIEDLGLEVYKNDELIQKADVSLMMFKPWELFEDIDKIFGLNTGDIVMTGTPKGVGLVEEGDEFEGRILEKGRVIVSKKWKVKK
ncbi:fumarylacetoacetate hydrolase family protein [Caminibacter pacificus]|uniref:2-keto-4-pentenoate hydratase/2-oxohepta-3-ene-1,7-dioic acid hydratase in catechol pathway n=1 Tax=Caminibacter pacificus TaxID=1424653 RepID=A0AAJ4RCA3_9BACT|nr:fumarylacetoacetate hydrolase family protein [Caminibacter pacificus]QCI28841.1 fumarylacetoacetate hydrolase family protein [Caminibacter pacificus]ROR39428.1 2-keto-4-pentenoate hydratase/2-oxohepta-3-ene-1,7-dioic acid hydratase in catechol pathway [Caminibacter pacificus]